MTTEDTEEATSQDYAEAAMVSCAGGDGFRACKEYEGHWLCLATHWRRRKRFSVQKEKGR